MNNCYFCHRPVYGRELDPRGMERQGQVDPRVRISWCTYEINAESRGKVNEWSHRECLEQAQRLMESRSQSAGAR